MLHMGRFLFLPDFLTTEKRSFTQRTLSLSCRLSSFINRKGRQGTQRLVFLKL
jgi:hypothetical protein